MGAGIRAISKMQKEVVVRFNRNQPRKLGSIVTTIAAQIEDAQSKFGRTFLSYIFLNSGSHFEAICRRFIQERAMFVYQYEVLC